MRTKEPLTDSLVAELTAVFRLSVTGHVGNDKFLIFSTPDVIKALSFDNRIAAVKPRGGKYRSQRKSRIAQPASAPPMSRVDGITELIVSLVNVNFSKEVF